METQNHYQIIIAKTTLKHTLTSQRRKQGGEKDIVHQQGDDTSKICSLSKTMTTTTTTQGSCKAKTSLLHDGNGPLSGPSSRRCNDVDIFLASVSFAIKWLILGVGVLVPKSKPRAFQLRERVGLFVGGGSLSESKGNV